MSKPSSKPYWTVGNPNFSIVTQEPSASKKLAGWLPDEKPPREYFNWLFWNLHEWVEYLETTTDFLLSTAERYDAVVGTVAGCSHSTLEAALSDGSLGNDCRVLVLSAETINTTINLSKDGWVIEFHPRAWFTKGTASTALNVTASRIRIMNGRFKDFTSEGIKLSSSSSNCIVRDCMFNNCTNDITDEGSNNVLLGNLTEE